MFKVLCFTVIACVLLIFVVAYYLIYERPPGVPAQKGVVVTEKAPLPQAGISQPAEKSTAKKPISAPPVKESLPIRLVGIYEHANEKVACMEDLEFLKTGYYKIGDNVRGATLIRILSDAAVLFKNGQRIILTLGQSYNWDQPGEWINVLSRDRFVVSRSRLGRKVLDANQLFQELIIVPNVTNAGIDGCYIASLKKDGIISQAGFEKGDIVKSVNGEKLDSLKKPLEIFQSLRRMVKATEGPHVIVEFERNKKPHTFNYKVLR